MAEANRKGGGLGRGTIGGKKRMKGGGLGLEVCRNWWQQKTNKVGFTLWQQKIPGGKLGVEPGGKPSGLKEPPRACKTLPDHDRLGYID